MFNPVLVRRDFGNAAAQYDRHATLQAGVMRQLITQIGSLPEDAWVLDAGCGTGQFSVASGHKRTLALDSAFAMCQQARQHTGFAINADMAEMPLADGSMDYVFSSLALQWAEDWQKTLHEWLRVLRPGGRFAFATFTQSTLHELAESFAAVDSFTHVSPFISAEAIQGFCDLEVTQQVITEYYPDLPALMRQLKGIGARGKHAGRRPALLTPRALHRAETYYRTHFVAPQGLRVSWNVLYAVGTKP